MSIAEKVDEPNIVYVDRIVKQTEIIEVIRKIPMEYDSIVVPTGLPVPKDALRRPISKLSGYGMRKHPVFKTMKMHTGIDIGVDMNTHILATASGMITRVKYSQYGYGNSIVVEHTGQNGKVYQTLYAHLNKILVNPGDCVSSGEVIGLSGNTGTSTSPHLHFEVIVDGKKVNPKPFITKQLGIIS